MNVNHELAHHYIAALSCTKEGAELVQALEAVRYYHSEGRIAQLGGGSMLVTAVDAYDDGDVKGLVLLPGTKDRLTYQSADWCDNTIRGALFWKDYHSYPVVIPYVLAEWAVQCVIERSEWVPAPTWCTKPVIHSVDTVPNMCVRLPLGLKLPGLTVDKYARRKATQPHYEKCEWGLYDHVGGNGLVYGYDAIVLYGVTAGEIVYLLNHIDVLDMDDINDALEPENFLFEFEKEAWRAACQFLSQYKAWEYFDTCSRYQCAKHLIENNFTPEDI